MLADVRQEDDCVVRLRGRVAFKFAFYSVSRSICLSPETNSGPNWYLYWN